jgi:hypothetical protein
MTCSDQSISPFPTAWVKDCCAQEEAINSKRKNAAARNLSAHFLFLIFSSLMPEEIQMKLKIVQKRQKIGPFLASRFQKHHKSQCIVKVKQKGPSEVEGTPKQPYRDHAKNRPFPFSPTFLFPGREATGPIS